MKKIIMFLALIFTFSTATMSCRDTARTNEDEAVNDVEMNDNYNDDYYDEDGEGDIEEAAEEVGRDIEEGAREVEEGIEEGAREIEEEFDNTPND